MIYLYIYIYARNNTGPRSVHSHRLSGSEEVVVEVVVVGAAVEGDVIDFVEAPLKGGEAQPEPEQSENSARSIAVELAAFSTQRWAKNSSARAAKRIRWSFQWRLRSSAFRP